MHRPILGLLGFAVMMSACVSLERRVEVTPGTVPPEIEGARWPETPIPYCIVRSDEGFADYETFVSLTQRAMETWGVPTRFDGECEGPMTAGNGVNEIGWGDLADDPEELNEAGNANIRYRSSPLGGAPEITEADITIEQDAARGRESEECLYTTLLHETGHFFGVQHLEMSTVMAPVITDCHQELTQADRDALAELYGSG